MTRFKSLILAASVVLTSTAVVAAPAAQLTGSTGKVLVDVGAGFAPVEGVVDLKAGDKVFVGEESGAVISYLNGCSVSVNAASVATVAGKAPCGKGQTAAVANQLITPVADIDAGCTGVGAFACGAPLLPLLLVGGAVAAGVVVVATGVLSDDDDGAAATAP
jgi:hypothetical protein